MAAIEDWSGLSPYAGLMQRAQEKLDEGLKKQRERTCPICAAPLDTEGRCVTCKRQIRQAPPLDDGSPQERKRAAFYERLRRQRQEREAGFLAARAKKAQPVEPERPKTHAQRLREFHAAGWRI